MIRTISRVLAAVMILLAMTPGCGAAEELYDEETSCWYTDADGGVKMLWYAGGTESFTAPEKIAGKKVVGIASYAFYETPVARLTLPPSVTVLDDFAFADSALEEIVIEGVLTSVGTGICDRTMNLRQITLPCAEAEFGDSMFGDCSSLTAVTVTGDIRRIDGRAFHGCGALRKLCAGGRIGDIGDGAFSDCPLLEEIDAPEISGNVGPRAFKGLALLRSVPALTGGTYIGEEAFLNCRSLESIRIGTHMAAIGRSAFENCAALREVRFPSALTEIGERAFLGCAGVTEVDIPDTVTRILPAAFSPSTEMTVGPGSAALEYARRLPNQGYRVRNGEEYRKPWMYATLDEAADAAVAEVITGDMSDYDKAKALHDYLCAHAYYDYGYEYYDAEGVLLFGTGVCNSYTLAYDALLERVGITSLHDNGDEHIYNLVYLDGEWYYADCTWDDYGTDGWGYVYFLIPLYALEGVSNHECYLRPHTATGYRQNYYYRNGVLTDLIYDVAVAVQYDCLAAGLTSHTFPLREDAVMEATGSPDSDGILRRLVLYAALHDYGYLVGDEYVNLDYAFSLEEETVTVRIREDRAPAERDGGCIYAAAGDHFRIPDPCESGRNGTVTWRIRTEETEESAYWPGYYLTLGEDGEVKVLPDAPDFRLVWIDLVADIRYEDGGAEQVLYHFCYDAQMRRETLTLPQNLREIHENAFEGGSFQRVIIGSRAEKLSSAAFGAVAALRSVQLLGRDTWFEGDPFSLYRNEMSFIVEEGSWAGEWCAVNHLSYVINLP